MPEFVTLRHPKTQETKEVLAASARFFPDFQMVAASPADEPPKRNSSADEWRTYVVDHGFASEEAAAELSRDALIALVPTTTEEN